MILTWGYETTLPAWDAASKQKGKAKAAWDAMIKALEKHEEKHRLYMLEQVAIFGEKVGNAQDLTKPGLAKLLGEMTSALQKAQDDYDSRTNHGQNEGVKLPAPDDVKE